MSQDWGAGSARSGDPARCGPALRRVERQASSRIVVPLANRAGRGASAAQIAEAMVATWQEIDAALTPIIGARGVAALYVRSLCVTSAGHPWLAGLHEGVQSTIDPAALRSVVARQTCTEAALGGNALFQSFYQLLGSLIGPSLTERLLRFVWSDTLGSPPLQDTRR